MALYRSPDYQTNWTFSSGKKVQNRFARQQPLGHLGFLIRTILTLFYLQVTQMLPTKFRVSLPFVSGEEVKNKFLTLKMPQKPASENVNCLCCLLNILANFSNLFLHTGKQCGP